MTILITGGSGLLGAELRKVDTTLIAPTRAELDITNLDQVRAVLDQSKPSIVIHLAAATTPPQHDAQPLLGVEHNIIGTANLALACGERGIRLIYTSSDYVYTGAGPHHEDEAVLPNKNFYWSKLGGECAVRLCPNSLILRLSFGPRPFPWEKVYADQWCSKLYVDEIAPLILAAARSSATGVMNVGGPRITIEDYARQTRPDIETIPRPAEIPADVSLDITRMQTALGTKTDA
jgi:dTDP-4-dehydrorhamnose reductase